MENVVPFEFTHRTIMSSQREIDKYLCTIAISSDLLIIY